MTARPFLDVPLLGAMAAGPMEIAGLPRLYQKGLLARARALASDCAYPDEGESRLLAALGIAFDAFDAFMHQQPAYLQTEAWISDNAVASETPSGVDPDAARHENLRDLDALHAFAIACDGTRDVPMAPAVSGLLAGRLGLLHLARLWAKATIDRAGLLPDGYNSGKGPLDEQCALAAGFDLAAAMQFIHTERPTFAAFEDWVERESRTLDTDTRSAWNERISTSLKPEFVAAPERELLGIEDPLERGGVLLNHLIDLHYFRLEILAA